MDEKLAHNNWRKKGRKGKGEADNAQRRRNRQKMSEIRARICLRSAKARRNILNTDHGMAVSVTYIFAASFNSFIEISN